MTVFVCSVNSDITKAEIMCALLVATIDVDHLSYWRGLWKSSSYIWPRGLQDYDNQNFEEFLSKLLDCLCL